MKQLSTIDIVEEQEDEVVNAKDSDIEKISVGDFLNDDDDFLNDTEDHQVEPEKIDDPIEEERVSVSKDRSYYMRKARRKAAIIDIVMCRICSAISGMNSENYKLSFEEKMEVQEAFADYEEVTKYEILTPSQELVISLIGVTAGKLIQASGDITKRKKEEKVKKAKSEIEKASTQEEKREKEVNLKAIREAEKVAPIRKKFRINKKTGFYEYPEKGGRRLKQDEQFQKPAAWVKEIHDNMTESGASDKEINSAILADIQKTGKIY
jgi:hypothetical protein